MTILLTIIFHLKPVDEINTIKPLLQAILNYVCEIYDGLNRIASNIEKLINNG